MRIPKIVFPTLLAAGLAALTWHFTGKRPAVKSRLQPAGRPNA